MAEPARPARFRFFGTGPARAAPAVASGTGPGGKAAGTPFSGTASPDHAPRGNHPPSPFSQGRPPPRAGGPAAGTPAETAARARVTAGALPPLLVAAERVAATVMTGVHGRRRAGTGDAFWQFRPFVTGDAAARIDWRQSGKTDRLFIREREWEAAQTVGLWRAADEGMRWSGGRDRPTKLERADLLLLALASLLLRGGERLRLFGDGRALAGRPALTTLAEALPRSATAPTEARLARHSRAVLFGDFLQPLAETRAAVSTLSAQGVTGHLVQILDPAEETLPFTGRVRFEPLSSGGSSTEFALVPRVETVRALYAERLAAHRDGLAAIAAASGWRLLHHRTDHAPATALLALWQALSPARGGRA